MQPFAQRIAAAVAAELGLAADDVLQPLSPPSNPERGDLSLPCFPLAARLGTPGKDAALALAGRIAGLALSDVTAEAAGPFVNFRIEPAALAREVLSAVWSRTPYAGSDVGRGQTVVIDFSSPNIAKPFHLGHLRSTVIGWSLRQIHRALGYEVVGVNHLGDWGTQFGFMIAAWTRWKDEAEPRIAAGEQETRVFADLYARIYQESKERPELRDEARAWFAKLEQGDPAARELWRFFVERSKLEFARIYELLGIVHESDAGEAFYEDKMPATIERLKQAGLLVPGMTAKELAEQKVSDLEAKLARRRAERGELTAKLGAAELKEKERKKLEKRAAAVDGELPALEGQLAKARAAVPAEDDGRRPLGVNTKDHGFVIVVKSDGGTNYTTRDLTAALYRIETYRPAKIIYVTGREQCDHFEGWFEILRMLDTGWQGELVHVPFGRYQGMSTRAGTAVFLEEVLERARAQAREAAAQASKKIELSDAERATVARAIGTGAVKFFDLRAERTKDIDLSKPGEEGIDWDRLLDLKGDTGPYLEFAYARLAGILRRYEGAVTLEGADFALLGEPEARALIKALAELPGVVSLAATRSEPSVIARAVIDLAQKTHAFVHHHRVIDAAPTSEQAAAGVTPERLRAARVLLVTCAKKAMGEALELLGIEPLEQM